jgi:Right handed beta helix region
VRGILVAALLVLTVPVRATATIIDVPADRPTIQDAVDAAAPGDTIRVAPGEYNESVRVTGAKDGLTIQARDVSQRPVIRGTPNKSADGIRVDRVDGLTISGIDIVGAYDGVRLNNSSDALLVDLRIEDNALGIRVYRGQGNRIVRCTVQRTRVEQGIVVDDSPGVVLSDSMVADAAYGGVRIRNSPCAALERMLVVDNRGSDGIKVEDCPRARLVACTASRNYHHGFLVSSAPDLVLTGNVGDDNQSAGLWIGDCAPFATVADVTGNGNGGSGNGQAAVVVVPPQTAAGGSPACGPTAAPTPAASATAISPSPSSSPPMASTPTQTATPAAVDTPPAMPVTTATLPPAPPTPAATPTPNGATPTPTAVASDPVGCRRAIARSGRQLLQVTVNALQKCEERLARGQIGPDPGPGRRLDFCLVEPTAAARIDRARAKVGATIDAACGGPDGICGTGDDHLDVQLDVGFPTVCPGIADGECANALTDCRAVGDCLICVHAAAVEAVIALAYDDVAGASDPPDVARALVRCRRSIGKETAKFLLAKAKALGKCWDDRLQGRQAYECPEPGGRTQSKIRAADAKRIAKICHACGGADAACDQPITLVDPGPAQMPPGGSGGGDDLTPAEIGFAPTCPDVTVPADAVHGAVRCGGPVQTLADLVFCTGCVAERAVGCPDRMRVPEVATYPLACNPLPAAPSPEPGPTP